MIEVIANNWQPFLLGAGAGITALMGYAANSKELEKVKFTAGKKFLILEGSDDPDFEPYSRFAGHEVIVTEDWSLSQHNDGYVSCRVILTEEEQTEKKKENKDAYKEYLKQYADAIEYCKKHEPSVQSYPFSQGGYGGGGGYQGQSYSHYYMPSNPVSADYLWEQTMLIPVKYLEGFEEKEEVIKTKKGGHKMPKIFKWSLYAALCSLVWQVVGNAPAVAQYIISLFVK